MNTQMSEYWGTAAGILVCTVHLSTCAFSYYSLQTTNVSQWISVSCVE
jgi:hypothetical protein